MGGSAMALYFLLTEMEKGVDPLGPSNILVLSTSVLTGTPIPGANRYTVASKSPLTNGFAESEAGGYFSVELKRAGYDAIIIKGKSTKPIYLWITSEKVEFRDAAHLWNHDTGYAQYKIREELQDKKISIYLQPMKIIVTKLKCKRCEHEWVARKPVVIVCPACKSPYWNKERKKPFTINL